MSDEQKNISVDDIKIEVYGASDIGNVRQENQDSFYLNGVYSHKRNENDDYSFVTDASESQIYAVFDGLGGEEGGEVSSRTACEVMSEFQKKITEANVEELYDVMCEFATEANDKICKALGSTYIPRGGTTFVAVQISDGVIHPFYLGDSRAYLGFEDSMYLLTEDHTVAMAEIKAGKMTPEEARYSPKNHTLTNFLGDQPGAQRINVDASTGLKIEPGINILLCSDGLHDYVESHVIFQILMQSEDPAKDLVKAAIASGGYDNVTPVVLRFVAK